MTAAPVGSGCDPAGLRRAPGPRPATRPGRPPMIRRMTVRPDVPPIRLTELTECGGCAAKLGADLLAEALAGLGAGEAADPALIAGPLAHQVANHFFVAYGSSRWRVCASESAARAGP